jgi:ferritin-like metal-binding protein YciE
MRNGVRTEKHYPNAGGPTMKNGKYKNRDQGSGRGPSTKNKTPHESPPESLKKLYEDDLKDIYWAENHLLETLPRMVSAAESSELRTAFEDHLAQTKIHISRLKHVFESSGLKVSAKKCEGMEGLTKEGDEMITRHVKGSVRDSGLIIAGQKVEHYEIAAYGSLRTLAQVMKLEEAAGVLQETLDEEGNANRLLTGLSRTINEQALNRSGVVK